MSPLHYCAGRRSRTMELQESPSMNGMSILRSPIVVAFVSQPLLSLTLSTTTISSFILKTTTPLLLLTQSKPDLPSIPVPQGTPPVGSSHYYPTRSQLIIFPIALSFSLDALSCAASCTIAVVAIACKVFLLTILAVIGLQSPQ